MPVQWTDDLATGVARIDEQHQELYRQVAALHEAMRAGSMDRVPAIVDFLQQYALEHFAMEEREMLSSGYPALSQHRRLHQRFVEDYLRHKALLAAGASASAVVALSAWLVEWLRDHVRTVDLDLARHLRKQAGR